MAWLVGENRVIASAEVAAGFGQRLRGLLGRDGIDGVLVLAGPKSVHTIGMRFPIDVAWCDGDGVVLRSKTIAPHRVSRPVWSAKQIIEAEAGAFERWNVRVGDKLELRS